MNDSHDIKAYNKGTFSQLKSVCDNGDSVFNIPKNGKVNYRNGQKTPDSQKTMTSMRMWQNPQSGKEDQYIGNASGFLSSTLPQLSYNEAKDEGWFPPLENE